VTGHRRRPLRSSDGRPARRLKPDGPTEERIPGSGLRVLVVNDTQEILELFDAILGELGFEAVLMSFAPRELDQVRAIAPDLCILDLVFGDRAAEGWQLLQKLRMTPEFETLPIIVCTAAVQEVREQEGYLTEQGVLLVLKPFTYAQLEEALRRAVEMAERRDGVAAATARFEARGQRASGNDGRARCAARRATR
jgi:CheY-like chemotaxis protein